MYHSYERLLADKKIWFHLKCVKWASRVSRIAGGLANEQESCHEKTIVFSISRENINYFGGLNLILADSQGNILIPGGALAKAGK
jgi:hypothetical protein